MARARDSFFVHLLSGVLAASLPVMIALAVLITSATENLTAGVKVLPTTSPVTVRVPSPVAAAPTN